MKNIFISLFLVLFLISCSDEGKKWYIEETWDIVEWYVDTLEWSIGDAKEARDLMNIQQGALNENIEALKE